MDAGLVRLIPQRIEGLQSPKPASFDVLRLCANERDAALVSLRLSHLTQKELAARIGVSPQALSKWMREGVPGGRVRAFCNATGTRLLEQFHALHHAMREAAGAPRESERIARIAAIAEAA